MAQGLGYQAVPAAAVGWAGVLLVRPLVPALWLGVQLQCCVLGLGGLVLARRPASQCSGAAWALCGLLVATVQRSQSCVGIQRVVSRVCVCVCAVRE